MLVGAAVTVAVSGILTPAVSPATREAVTRLGVHTVAGLVPTEVFNWHGLLTMRGLAYMLGGGFLAGFGSSYAGGCTSGHGVMGLASRQLASLIAIVGIFAGGLVATFILMPALE